MNTITYSHFFESLNQKKSLESFKQIYTEDVYFKDPFNETKGIDEVYKIFQEMYEKLDYPRFEVIESIRNKTVCYLRWHFIFCFKNEQDEQSFEGITRLETDSEGKIISHIDYWDAAEHIYEKLPLLGSLLRFIKRKVTTG